MIRHPEKADIAAIAALEAAAFPQEEAASEARIADRAEAFPECFWLLEEDGQIIAFINGMASNEPDLRDEMYEFASLHEPDGEWQMLFSVATAPDRRLRGYASEVMREVISDCRRKRKGIVLTCKERLLPFYERFGYVDEGISESTHGGAVWHKMRLMLENADERLH